MTQQGKNEGEGNRTADREYRKAATEHAKSHDIQREGRDASKALDESVAEELREAEREGKSRAKNPTGN